MIILFNHYSTTYMLLMSMSYAFVLLIHQDNLFTLNWIINTYDYDIFVFIQACILRNSFWNNNLTIIVKKLKT